MVPCLCTNPMTQYYCYNNIPPSSTSFLNYQRAAESTIIYGFSHANPPFHVEYDQEEREQTATNEPDSYYGQVDHQMRTQGIQVNYDDYYGKSSQEALAEQQKQIVNFSQGIFQNEHSTAAGLFYVRFSQPT